MWKKVFLLKKETLRKGDRVNFGGQFGHITGVESKTWGGREKSGNLAALAPVIKYDVSYSDKCRVI